GVPSKSLSCPRQPAIVGPGKHRLSSESPSPVAPNSKWPVSIARLTLAWSEAHGTSLVTPAELYSGWKLKAEVKQSLSLVFRKPFAALATMNADPPEVRSFTLVVRPFNVSSIVIRSVSAGFIRKVLPLG